MSPSARSEKTTRPGSGRAGFACMAVLLALWWACGPPRERFHGTYSSPEALAEAFLKGLEARDRAGLEGLVLSKEEFQLEAFPEMPVYGNIPTDFAWSQIEARNIQGLSSVLDAQGGHGWDLEEMVFRGGRTEYQTFSVRRKPMLHLRDRATGEKRTLAFFGSILEHGGRCKLVSFNIDR